MSGSKGIRARRRFTFTNVAAGWRAPGRGAVGLVLAFASRRPLALIIFGFAFLDVAVLYRFLAAEGIPMHGDLAFPLSLERFRSSFFPLWNPFSSTGNVENINRLFLMLPLIDVARALHLSIETFVKFVFVATLLTSQIAMYLWVHALLRERIRDARVTRSGAVVGALLYGFSPWVMPRMSAFFFWVAYAVAPLMLLLFTRGIQRGRIRYLVWAAVLWSLGSGSPHFALMLGLLIAAWAIFLALGSRVAVRGIAICLTVLALSYMLLNTYWIWPAIQSWAIEPVSPGYVVSSTDLDLLSRNSSVLNVLLGRDEWFSWWTSPLIHGSGPLHLLWLFASVGVFAACIPALSNGHLRRVAGFFLVVALAALTLAMGTRGPASTLYHWLIFDAPGAASWGWLLRAPEKWGMLLWFAIATSAGIGLPALIVRRGLRSAISKAVLTTALVAAVLLFTLPKMTAGTWGPYVPVKIPHEYAAINGWLSRQSGEFKVLWLAPYEFGKSSRGGEAVHTWAPGHEAGYVFPRSSSQPSYGGFHYINPFAQYRSFIQGHLSSAALWKLLAPAGIRYVVYQADIIGAEARQSQDLAHLRRNLTPAYQRGDLHVLENRYFSTRISGSQTNLMVYGGLRAFTALSDFDGFDPRVSSLLFRHQQQVWPGSAWDRTTPLLYGMGYQESAIEDELMRSQLLIWPFDSVTNGDAGRDWARLRISNPYDGRWPWHTYLQDWLNVRDRWDFDFGRGVITTFASKASVTLPFVIPRAGDYRIYARVFRHPSGGRLSLEVDDSDVASVSTVGLEERFVWEPLAELALDEGVTRFSIHSEQGHNTLNAIGLLPTDRDGQPDPPTTEPYLFLGESVRQARAPSSFVSIPSGRDSQLIILSASAGRAQLRLVPEGPTLERVSDGDVLEARIRRNGDSEYFLLLGKTVHSLATTGTVDGVRRERLGWQTWQSSVVPIQSLSDNSRLHIALDLFARNVKALHVKVVWLAQNGSRRVSYLTASRTGTFHRLVGEFLRVPVSARGIRVQVAAAPPDRGRWSIRRLEVTRVDPPPTGFSVLAIPEGMDGVFSGVPRGVALSEPSSSATGPVFVGSVDDQVVRLTESYDPYWLGEVLTDGGASVGLADHFPVYGAMNGFASSVPGETLRVSYGPHFWLLAAVGVSSLVLAGFGMLLLLRWVPRGRHRASRFKRALAQRPTLRIPRTKRGSANH
jgi:hypothetical protein